LFADTYGGRHYRGAGQGRSTMQSRGSEEAERRTLYERSSDEVLRFVDRKPAVGARRVVPELHAQEECETADHATLRRFGLVVLAATPSRASSCASSVSARSSNCGWSS